MSLLQNATPETQQDIHLSVYWRIIVKHRRIVAVALILALAIGTVVSLLSPPSYRATTTLSVEPDKTNLFDFGSFQYSPYDPSFLPTQLQLMRSREVAERVVKRLHLEDNPEVVPPRSGFFSKASPSAAQAISTVQSNIAVVPVSGTTLVQISYVSGSPKLAADIANALSEAYVDWSLESKFAVIGQASRFVASQIEQLKSDVTQKEQQLQAYARRQDIVSVDPQTNVTLQKLETLNHDYASAVADRVSKEARFSEIQSARPEAIVDNIQSTYVQQLKNDQAKLERDYAEKLSVYKPEWQAMQQLKAQIDKGRQHLDAAIQDAVNKAREAARNDYLTALHREQSLKEILSHQQDEAMKLNSNAVEYNNLKTEVDTKRTLLDSFLKRQAETEVAARLRGERVSNIRIVDRAIPPTSRFRPSYVRNGLMAVYLGLAIGAALAFLIEYLDRSIRSAEHVTQWLGLPALGVIPATNTGSRAYGYGYSYGYGTSRGRGTANSAKGSEDKDDRDIAVELIPHLRVRSRIAEAYREFRAALLLSQAGGLRVLAITSALPAEGKTSTAANLAVVLGQLGKRIVLIDCDLHKPRLHEIFRISNRAGLVSILAAGVPPNEALVATNVPGVSVIPSGPSSPNPSGLLASTAMKNLLELLKSKYDYVVLDTPPVTAVADAILLGHETDGVVLCVKGGVTPREQVARTRDKLMQSQVRILGVLINNIVEDSSLYGYAKYYQSRYYTRPSADEVSGSRAAAG